MNALAELDLDLLPPSLVSSTDADWGLARAAAKRHLVVLAQRGAPLLDELEGDFTEHRGRTLVVGPTTARNAAALRAHLPWLAPVLIGPRLSAGLGDRLGLATPGHVRAVRAAGGAIAPVFAQQSIREMDRTLRSPRQVIDDAMWGVFEEGWRGGFGADADHLKTSGDIDRCAEAGFTLFTIDPGEHVDRSAGARTSAELAAALARLPWARLEDSADGLRRRYLGRRFDFEGLRVTFDEGSLAEAAVKYGRAVAHVSAMSRRLARAAGGRAFELEVSVDETEEPTSHAEHVYVSSELARLGVSWVSLAPRFVGRFEKGVDYIGDLEEFERHFAGHAAIARGLGPYKLSLHSGSDKFSIYPAAARHARGLVHLKTAGTSYLEALRTVAAIEPACVRELYAFARERYERDRSSYHVSASLARAAAPAGLSDADLAGLLDDFDAREILHVTFGSVLAWRGGAGRPRLGERLMALLAQHPEAYAARLEAHLSRHLAPFAAAQDSF